jgi:hypothetical protein
MAESIHLESRDRVDKPISEAALIRATIDPKGTPKPYSSSSITVSKKIIYCFFFRQASGAKNRARNPSVT